MNRAILFLGVVVALGAAVWFWNMEPVTARNAGPGTTVEVVEQAGQMPASVAKGPAAPATRPATEAPEPPPEGAGTDAAVAPTALPSGPFEVNLGTHAILLKTPPDAPKKMLDVEVVLVTPEPVTRKEIINRRRQLVRMLFFLGTRRAANSAAAEGGRSLFAGHLLERYRNVVKSGPIKEIRFPTWQVRDYVPAAPDEDGEE